MRIEGKTLPITGRRVVLITADGASGPVITYRRYWCDRATRAAAAVAGFARHAGPHSD